MATSIGIGVSPVFQLKKAALPSPDLYYDLSLKSNEHPTRNIIDDMSGNGRHATIYNALYAEGSGYGKYAYEGAFVFDGIDDYARIENITKGFKTLFMEVVPFKTGGILFDQRMRDGVQVGGRNLLRGTSNEWITITTTTSAYINNFYKDTILEPNQSYTFSWEAELVSGTAGGEVHIGCGNTTFQRGILYSDVPIIGKSSITFTPTEDHLSTYKSFAFRWYNKGNVFTFRYRNLKLEKGDKPTDWSPAPEDVFAISNLPNTIAYNERNPNGVTYINGELNTNKYTDDMQNHRQVITIVNPTDTTQGSASIGAAFNFSEGYSSMALYKVIGFYDELTPEQIQKVITKYNLKYEQI